MSLIHIYGDVIRDIAVFQYLTFAISESMNASEKCV